MELQAKQLLLDAIQAGVKWPTFKLWHEGVLALSSHAFNGSFELFGDRIERRFFFAINLSKQESRPLEELEKLNNLADEGHVATIQAIKIALKKLGVQEPRCVIDQTDLSLKEQYDLKWLDVQLMNRKQLSFDEYQAGVVALHKKAATHGSFKLRSGAFIDMCEMWTSEEMESMSPEARADAIEQNKLSKIHSIKKIKEKLKELGMEEPPVDTENEAFLRACRRARSSLSREKYILLTQQEFIVNQARAHSMESFLLDADDAASSVAAHGEGWEESLHLMNRIIENNLVTQQDELRAMKSRLLQHHIRQVYRDIYRVSPVYDTTDSDVTESEGESDEEE
uniref:Uncharacterized protein n=1 Tax=Entomoneis paludosa TaxID=265537 RepID=A0A7S2Y6C6_9STRA